MRTAETVERQIRNLGRDVIPPQIKRYLWFYYMEMKRIVETRSLNMFSQVHLEVNTHCNRACSYCSNSLYPKKEAYMDGGLYRKIIDELAEIDYHGRISPNLSSEPTLHPKLAMLMTYARKVKNAQLVVYTDGDSLNRDNFDELKNARVDQFIITQHGQNAPQSLTELMESLTDQEKRHVTYQTLADVNLFNRGIPGLIPEGRRAIPDPCFLVNELTVLVNGDVAQCGNDFIGENVFGNANERSIMEIWHDPTYRDFRRGVKQRQYNSDVCYKCIFDASKPQNKYH